MCANYEEILPKTEPLFGGAQNQSKRDDSEGKGNCDRSPINPNSNVFDGASRAYGPLIVGDTILRVEKATSPRRLLAPCSDEVMQKLMRKARESLRNEKTNRKQMVGDQINLNSNDGM